MSHERSTIRPSRPSVRYSPYSSLYAPVSARRPPLLPGQHSPIPDGGGAANDSSVTYVSPASVNDNPLSTHHSSYPAPQRSFPSQEFSPDYPFPQEPTRIAQTRSCLPDRDGPYRGFPQQSAHFAQPPLPERVYPQPTANIPYPNPATPRSAHLLSNSRLHSAQPSIILSRPEESTYRNFSVGQPQLENPQGRALTVPVRQPTSYQNQGMLSGSHDLLFSDNTFIDNSITSDNFMKEFLQHTLIGAEYDSSDRFPPPRCHPGTRLAIIERCKAFVAECNGQEKMRWVVGPAGVGKSAIMQVVAEDIPADASVFLSVNGRRDGWKTLTTIAYQLATKYEPYRQFIRTEITRDPSLLRKLLPAQFNKFVVEPFMHRRLFNHSRRFLVIIDGLDECDNPITPLELLQLISNFCLAYPTSPVVWFIASRPEPYICSFFEGVSFWPAYTKEEIIIDSDEACEDVQRYLRAELENIRCAYPILKRKREWPSELDFTKIAAAAGGLFAYASTVVRYISDPRYQNPAAQLRRVLEDIDAAPKDDVLGRTYSMAQLDALYTRILSNIPDDVMIYTRKLLLIYSEVGWNRVAFRAQCNMLGFTDDAAYGAVCHLHAVMKVPAPDEADKEPLQYFHKSFSDFLFDFKRSGFSRNVRDEVEQLRAQSSSRIIGEVPDNFDSMTRDEDIECNGNAYLKSGCGFLDNISLSWASDECSGLTDDRLRCHLYTVSMEDLCARFSLHTNRYANISNFNALTTRFAAHGSLYPFYELRSTAFDRLQVGKFKQVPLRTMNYAAICGMIDLWFMGPVFKYVDRSDPWNSSCQHTKSEQGYGWNTQFVRSLADPENEEEADILVDNPRFNIRAGKVSHWHALTPPPMQYQACLYCSRRLAQYFKHNPDQLATVFVDSTELCYVELIIADPEDDGMSKWRYRFFHSGLPMGT